MMNSVSSVFTTALLFLMAFAGIAQQSPLVFPGGHGAGRGKHVVLIAGDQEYRSEESIPALAQILAVRHGFPNAPGMKTSAPAGNSRVEGRTPTMR